MPLKISFARILSRPGAKPPKKGNFLFKHHLLYKGESREAIQALRNRSVCSVPGIRTH